MPRKPLDALQGVTLRAAAGETRSQAPVAPAAASRRVQGLGLLQSFPFASPAHAIPFNHSITYAPFSQCDASQASKNLFYMFHLVYKPRYSCE